MLRLLPPDAVTEHSVELPAGTLAYTATAGTLSLFDQTGERSAAIFYTAYVAKDAETGNRPVTFAFNGGPGAASAFLTLGLVGPRIAELMDNDPSATRLRDNPQTWLAFTDLVMVDPVGTGWSRAAKPDGAAAFYGVRRDAEALAKFVALYLAKNGRSASPKYPAGRKLRRLPRRQGGARAAARAGHHGLRHRHGVAADGGGADLRRRPLCARRSACSCRRWRRPSWSARARFTPQAQAEAERFALTDYLVTLAGAPPKGDRAREFYAKLAEVSGLPEAVVTRSRGFIRDAYVKHLRSAERKIVSRYDATYAVADPYPDRETSRGPDPLLDGLTRAYGSTFANYARDELGYKTDMTYVLLASDISGKWDWEGGRAQASISDDLRELLSLTPSFRLLVSHGYSDMVTPYAVSRYVLDHLPPIGEPERAQLRVYRGGHMFYIDAESRKAFTADARNFYQSTQ